MIHAYLLILNLVCITMVMGAARKQWLTNYYLFHWMIIGVTAWIGCTLRILYVGL